MLDPLLVANRGEIACRVIRTARAMGLRTVAIYSDADHAAPHVRMADQAVRIGPAPVGESYLSIPAVLDAARRTGARAVHPGYGFLSENADFARACADAGLVFVGPPPDAIDAMADKSAAKARMIEAGVPCVPGFQADDPDDETLIAEADGLGFPLLVKAAAGGGGRGMRRVARLADLPAALASARREATSAFGSGHLLLERLVEDARHVEVQVLADEHGHVVHLGERDCSVQRRHQKVVEEAPSPAVDADLRHRMGEAACAAARAVGYTGAGTVEFLLAPDGAFYFLEMNTRLQVEHPVTEEVTGLDLVALQLDVARGTKLADLAAFADGGPALTGHAIEVRLYAEEPAADYAPRTGRLEQVVWPTREGVRVDHGVRAGTDVSAHYDPMLAKIIAWGPDRDTARRRLLRALDATVVAGVSTNRAFLQRVLRHDVFVHGEATTGFLDATPTLRDEPPRDDLWPAVAAHLAHVSGMGQSSFAGFRSSHAVPQTVPLSVSTSAQPAPAPVLAQLGRAADGALVVGVGGGGHRVALSPADGTGWRRLSRDGATTAVFLARDGDASWVQHHGALWRVALWDPAPESAEEAGGDGRITAPSAGRVLSVEVSPGQRVEPDDVVAVIEAMKLETSLLAGVAGEVIEIRAAAGDAVAQGAVLIVVAPDASDDAPTQESE